MNKDKFEELILDFRRRCLCNDFALGNSFWIDNYEFEVVNKKRKSKSL